MSPQLSRIVRSPPKVEDVHSPRATPQSPCSRSSVGQSDRLLSGRPEVRILLATPQTTPKALILQGFRRYFLCLCFRIDDELRLFFAHVFRVHITITLNQLANKISRNFRFLLIKIAFLLIAQKIVLKILLIEKSAHNSSNLFYPVPFYPLFILCQGFPATHIFQNDRIII